jgi:hypothetical protein
MRPRQQLQPVAGPEPELRAVVTPSGWRFWLDATGGVCYALEAPYRVRALECGCGGCTCTRSGAGPSSWPYRICPIHRRGCAELAWSMGALDEVQG